MSWPNVRNTLTGTVEGLVPESTDVGGTEFMHVADQQIEDVSRDRVFAVVLTAPPSHVGQVTTAFHRWMSSFDVVVRYERTSSIEADQDRISEDCVQIQEALLTMGNHHADVMGLAAQGEGFAGTALDDDDDGYTLTISFTIHHT